MDSDAESEEESPDGQPEETAKEDEDMFGDSFTEPSTKDPATKRNQFLESQEIQGQEWNAQGQDFTEDGVRIEPFNMDQEMEEG